MTTKKEKDSDFLETSPGLEKPELTPETVALSRAGLKSSKALLDTCSNCGAEIYEQDDYKKHFEKTGHALFASSGNGQEMKF